jgi:hypothetical protein
MDITTTNRYITNVYVHSVEPDIEGVDPWHVATALINGEHTTIKTDYDEDVCCGYLRALLLLVGVDEPELREYTYNKTAVGRALHVLDEAGVPIRNEHKRRAWVKIGI